MNQQVLRKSCVILEPQNDPIRVTKCQKCHIFFWLCRNLIILPFEPGQLALTLVKFDLYLNSPEASDAEG